MRFFLVEPNMQHRGAVILNGDQSMENAITTSLAKWIRYIRTGSATPV